MRVLIASIIGAVVLFAWCITSWMYLPWHSNSLYKFKDSGAVTNVIKENVDVSGVYLTPEFKQGAAQNSGDTENSASEENQPQENVMIFSVVSLEGMANMNMAMVFGFLTQFIAAFLVCVLLAKSHIHSYFCKLLFVVIFALAAGVACHLPNWNWWRFPTMYTMINLADLLIGWFLAGLFMAAIVKCNPEHHTHSH